MSLFSKFSGQKNNQTATETTKFLHERLQGYLSELGFKKHGSCFYRKQGELIHIINLQPDKWNQTGDTKYYINFGVFYAPLHEVYWGDKAPDFPQEYLCPLRMRIRNTKVEEAWHFTNKTDTNMLSEELAARVQNEAKRYFYNIETPTDLADAIMGKKDGIITVVGNINRGIIYALQGDKKQGQQEFDKYFQENDRINHDLPSVKMLLRGYKCMAEKVGLQFDHRLLGGEQCVGFYVEVKGKEPIKNERKTLNKLYTYLSNLEGKGLGYQFYYAPHRKTGLYRIAFCTTEPDEVITYINERKDKFPQPIHSIIRSDSF